MPAIVRRLATLVRLPYIRLRNLAANRRLSHMSPSAVFAEVYAEDIWGSGAGNTAFDSGGGSEDAIGRAYCDSIAAAIDVRPDTVLVDLGCGDFRIGHTLHGRVGGQYIGVDVVPELIEHLESTYAGPSVEFRCLDITSDALPAGDICLIRQVFQHLSNEEIAAVLDKLAGYKRVFVTEHYPADEGPVIPNLDKVHGPETRLPLNSAVYLDRRPFRRVVRELLAVPAGHGVIRTFELLNVD
jgi:hypothetical protein